MQIVATQHVPAFKMAGNFSIFTALFVMNPVEWKARTKDFAHKCVRIGSTLPDDKLGSHIAGQLIRSSTSVASNYRAACRAQSSAIFIDKPRMVIEAADETQFWLEFGRDEGLFSGDLLIQLLKEPNELISIFVASRKSAVNNRKLHVVKK